MKDQTKNYLLVMVVGFNDRNAKVQLLSDDDITTTVEQKVSSIFKGFNETTRTGFFKGKKEKALQIEIVTDREEDQKKLKGIASKLCKYLNQESILVYCIPLQGFEFVERVGAL